MSSADYAAALSRYEEIVAEYPDLKVKGKANRYTAMNGNMFSALQKDGTLTVRLSETDKKAYNEEHGTSDVISYGSVMRGYVYVTPEIWNDDAALRALFKRCVEHAQTLKPKPTRKT
ncbi:MAG: TfoX/Sxy family protein [Erythrobacter sp.]|nr:TfoX/Sxy family protein [Erythrobacter sp.]